MNGLINYWSFNGNYDDSIGGAHLSYGENANLTFDRFNRSNSALNLTSGFLKAPNGVYFNSNFTFMAWIRKRENVIWSRIIDFGNGISNNNILITMFTSISTPNPHIRNYNGSSINIELFSMANVKINDWYHLSFVLNYPNLTIYTNGNITGTGIANGYPSNVTRTKCYIGRSNWSANDDVNADLDEIKIFNRALSNEEILYEMNYDE
jgi:hypothetical protein